jgi:RHS repeat-associated protein
MVKAFVNIIVFDKNHKLLDFAWDGIDPSANQAGATPVVAHDYVMREYTAKEEGFVYLYVSNESPTLVDVYFDDVAMTYTPGNVVQYNEYYPFGLQTANSWTRENATGNNFLYNGGTELNTTTSVYDLHYRNYDPILGRMNQVDPLAGKYASMTPYNYAFNDPVYFNDPLGDESVTGGTAACSWCMSDKPRPIDPGSSGWGGGGGGYSNGGFIVNPGIFSAENWAKISGLVNTMWNNTDSYNGRSVWNGSNVDYFIGDKLVGNGRVERIYQTSRQNGRVNNVLGINKWDRLTSLIELKPGPIFFKNEGDAYKYMWENSFDEEGNVRSELSAFIVPDGVLVLPTEGRRNDGSYGRNGPRNSYNDYLPLSRNSQTKKIYVTYNGNRLEVRGQVHTHPNTQPFGDYEVEEDLKFQNQLNIPVYIIRTDGFYDLGGNVLGTQSEYFSGEKSLVNKK